MRKGGTRTRVLGAAVVLGVCFSSVAAAQQMTSGPAPSPGTDRGLRAPDRAQVVLTEVPAYIWHHGCGPTACGMIIGYYDTHGFDALVPGSAATQTAEVNAMIADDSGNPNCALADGDHYQDYSCPRDDSGPILADRSETGGAHPSNCVADFMRTSWSSVGNRYGWAWGSDVVPALAGYVSYASSYMADVVTQSFSQLTWTEYRAEIDSGRPVALLVDTDGSGQTDHFVTAIGYNTATGEYACRDTWDTGVHWYDWSAMSGGNPWGIYSATTFYLYPLPDLVIAAVETRPDHPACLDSVEARAAVINQGGSDSDWFWVHFRCGDDPPVSALVSYLAQGDTLLTDWVSLGAPGEGSHLLLTCADGTEAVAEGDESNNCREKRFDVGPCDPSAVPLEQTGPASSDPAGAEELRLRVPNPYQPNQGIDLEFSFPGEAFVAIYDAAGRRVRLLQSGPVAGGRLTSRWDGRNDRGHVVPPGVYFLRADLDGARARRTLVFQR